VEDCFVPVNNDRVTGIIPTLITDHDIGMFGKDISDLPLPLIAPLSTDHGARRKFAIEKPFRVVHFQSPVFDKRADPALRNTGDYSTYKMLALNLHLVRGKLMWKMIARNLRDDISRLKETIQNDPDIPDKVRVLLDRAEWSYPAPSAKDFLDQAYDLVEDPRIKELKKRASDYYRYSGESLEEIACRWVKEDQKMADGQDRFHAKLPVRQLWPIREYTWSRSKARPGYAYNEQGEKVQMEGEAKWDAMKRDMKQHGWRGEEQPVLVDIGKNGKAKVSEGNHRLAIAREIGLREVPVRFFFRQEVGKGEMLCRPDHNIDELTELLT
jgi:hypothetical protein